ncbi:haspin protein kinase [Salpingoeca rosetta]|uniref:non-specific serine/threonine protein kinase n=1 Tax=Salpingoeca rosetta (strain ATCC 50818 / BSB-021) TaxID=946362 RepID=F2UEJ8_SALR5|nr:haspin protein kinase [Salpingoeca rosetta]EGD75048.1 haspin protein kinase [Salpingoeca rosetta]|eukprot:XP_004992101.1 haspin protein kinase [Salpingoeca rosetta]
MEDRVASTTATTATTSTRQPRFDAALLGRRQRRRQHNNKDGTAKNAATDICSGSSSKDKAPRRVPLGTVNTNVSGPSRELAPWKAAARARKERGGPQKQPTEQHRDVEGQQPQNRPLRSLRTCAGTTKRRSQEKNTNASIEPGKVSAALRAIARSMRTSGGGSRRESEESTGTETSTAPTLTEPSPCSHKRSQPKNTDSSGTTTTTTTTNSSTRKPLHVSDRKRFADPGAVDLKASDQHHRTTPARDTTTSTSNSNSSNNHEHRKHPSLQLCGQAQHQRRSKPKRVAFNRTASAMTGAEAADLVAMFDASLKTPSPQPQPPRHKGEDQQRNEHSPSMQQQQQHRQQQQQQQHRQQQQQKERCVEEQVYRTAAKLQQQQERRRPEIGLLRRLGMLDSPEVSLLDGEAVTTTTTTTRTAAATTAAAAAAAATVPVAATMSKKVNEGHGKLSERTDARTCAGSEEQHDCSVDRKRGDGSNGMTEARAHVEDTVTETTETGSMEETADAHAHSSIAQGDADLEAPTSEMSALVLSSTETEEQMEEVVEESEDVTVEEETEVEKETDRDGDKEEEWELLSQEEEEEETDTAEDSGEGIADAQEDSVEMQASVDVSMTESDVPLDASAELFADSNDEECIATNSDASVISTYSSNSSASHDCTEAASEKKHSEQENDEDCKMEASDVEDASEQQNHEQDRTSVAVSDILELCHQPTPCTFVDAFGGDDALAACIKVGEGSYGEVFALTPATLAAASEKCQHEWHDAASHGVAFKLMPVDGETEINGGLPKRTHEMVSEIACTLLLSAVSEGLTTRENPEEVALQIPTFIRTHKLSLCQGQMPAPLLDQWDCFLANDKNGECENERPDVFPAEQLHLCFAFENGGKSLEHFKFTSLHQAQFVLLQVLVSVGLTERALQFEHRDLHVGNVLVRQTKTKHVCMMYASQEVLVPTGGFEARIIDFTLSRIDRSRLDLHRRQLLPPPSFDADVHHRHHADSHGSNTTASASNDTRDNDDNNHSSREGIAFFDLADDPDIFCGEGDIQFDVYRDMRELVTTGWHEFLPRTNVLWIEYLTKHILNKKYTSTAKREAKVRKSLDGFLSRICGYASCFEAICNDAFVKQHVDLSSIFQKEQ